MVEFARNSKGSVRNIKEQQVMTDAQQREAARQFFYKWKGKGNEDEDARSYWIEILDGIFGVENVTGAYNSRRRWSAEMATRNVLTSISRRRMF